MKLVEFLGTQQEPLPNWLANYLPGSPFPRNDFFQSRTVFYPGSGTDGHPVELFGSSHSCHGFVYVDYGKDLSQIQNELDSDHHGFLGYLSLDRRIVQEKELTPQGWIPHVAPGEVRRSPGGFASATPFALLEILERHDSLTDSHGPKRLAILFIGGDGIATFDALYCQGASAIPFGVVLQDHGYGGNYDRFGKGGILDTLANRCRVLPPWLLVAENTTPWDGYDLVPMVMGDEGGVNHSKRRLFQLRNGA